VGPPVKEYEAVLSTRKRETGENCQGLLVLIIEGKGYAKFKRGL